ncbi:MAG: hypothetical protein HQL54_14695, partial [Magnetococcales bacterium]|nr:hypothetical protein [Magnetococcales bacterium]
YYLVDIALVDSVSIQQSIRGTVVIEGKAVSLAGLFIDRVQMMMLRELNF